MKTEWDYTNLACAYVKRPKYSEDAINEMCSLAGVVAGDAVCDVGAGVGHLTIELAERGLLVTAVEPNDAMRQLGIKRTQQYENVLWYEGIGECTGLADSQYSLVTFGSSFNVTNRQNALIETNRILNSGGWFACMWNHRDLQDPLQAKIEDVIRQYIPTYNYGTRREDQTKCICDSMLFGNVSKIKGRIIHHQSNEDCVEAWRSHATLKRQADDKFNLILEGIERLLSEYGEDDIRIPYETVMWMAQNNKT